MSTISPRGQRGSALIVAIFLLVALAALGAYIAGISSGQHIGSAQDVQGARAYQAARYGSEWGVYQVLRGACAGGDYCASCRAATYDAPHRLDLTGLAGPLGPFTVSVYCGSGATYTEGDAATPPVRIYQIAAVACSQPNGGVCPNTTPAAVTGVGYIERRISLTLNN